MGISVSPKRSTEALIGYTPQQETSSKLVIVMVGLPATGKSYLAKKLSRYLNWLQHKTRVFNVGDRRREAAAGNAETAPQALSTFNAKFFDPTSPECVSLRDRLAINTLDELIAWLTESGGNIGILDATNSTRARRQLVLEHIRQRWCGGDGGDGGDGGVRILFLESRCSDAAIREANIRLKLSGPDYAGKDAAASLADFRRRVAHYAGAYEPLGAAEEARGLAFVQMYDAGRKMHTHRIRGYVLSQIVEYLLNFNLARRQVWVSCHGESLDDEAGRVGRHSDLSERGRGYAAALAAFVEARRRSWRCADPASGHDPDSPQFCVWTSTWPQAIQTGAAFASEACEPTPTKMLDGLNFGDMAGLTLAQVAAAHPRELAARRRDKLRYRWPGLGGEGYADLVVRLRPLIVELERTTDHLVLVTHRAVVRVLLAYLLGIHRDDMGEVPMPRDTVYCFDIEPYGISFRPFMYKAERGTFEQVPDSEIPFISNC